jgi:CRP-like cAMP-binding protein
VVSQQAVRSSSASVTATDAHGNVLLGDLPNSDVRELLPHLELVDMIAAHELYTPAVDIRYVYFPLSGLCSLVANPRAGVVDVGPIGFDGMVGLPTYLGTPTGPLTVTVHVGGKALRLDARTFQSCVSAMPALDRVLRRYVQWTYTGMGVWVACARLHEVQQRCARWLLMAHDRIREDHFSLTHDYLAQMLGVRRPTVSVAAGLLQEAGLIRYARGVVTVRNRKGLEEAACECYAIVTDEYQRIFGRTLRYCG